MAPPRLSVAPNDIQNVYPLAQRVPLGPSGHMHYAGTLGPGGAGHYWFYVPTTDPGRVIVTLEGGPSDIRLEDQSSKVLIRTTGEGLGHELQAWSAGIYHVFVTPVRPAQVRYICEGWPREGLGQGAGPLIPWNFWYYPFNPASGRKGGFDSAAIQKSAMEKFDRAFLPDQLGAAWNWEKNNHVRPTAEGWEGHCDMASFASVYFEEPRAKVPVRGVTFTRDELRLLASEWAGRKMPGDPLQPFKLEVPGYATVGGKFVVWFMKPSDEITKATILREYDRCFPGPGRESRAKVENDAERLDPEKVRADFGDVGRRFLKFLVDQVKLGGKPVLGDFGPTDPKRIGIEVWNVALVSFTAEWKELRPKDPKNKDPRSCAVELNLWTNLDAYPADAPLPPAVVNEHGRPNPVPGNSMQLTYELELHYDDMGRPQRAAFPTCRAGTILVYAPHTILDVPKPGGAGAAGTGNHFINDELIRDGALRLRSRFT